MAVGKPKPEQVFHVPADLAGRTVAAALRQWLAGSPWSQVRRLITSRRVTVNGNLCTAEDRRLKADEVVKVLAQSAPPHASEDDVRVQYLDEHLVVVEKPAGVTTNRHREERQWSRRRRQVQPTLDELLPHVITKLEGRRGHRGTPRPVRAVHRLDRETSGLIVFARTPAAEKHLAEQFRHHESHRRYLAIVRGKVKEQTIRSRLVRDRGDGRRGSTEQPNVGKEAVTHLKPVESVKGYTLVECRLETGRTHQIRIHLSEQGHPVCGEKVYADGKTADDGAPRLALHAAELGFVHPVSGKHLRFQAGLPAELADFWRRLKRPERPGTKDKGQSQLPG